jgi:hypothetical protein
MKKNKPGGLLVNRQDLDEKANQALEIPVVAAQMGNYVAVFTMLILQDMLIQLTVNPLTNFNNIIAIANSIANLNASIKSIQ